MKRIVCGILCALCAVPLSGESMTERQKRKAQELVRNQREGDRARRDAIVRQMRDFLGAVNNRAAADDGSPVELAAPVSADEVIDIRTAGHTHADNRQYGLVPAWAESAGAPLYTEPAGAVRCGRLAGAERVEVVYRMDVPNGGELVEWYMVRRADGSEGWIDSRYLLDRQPGAVQPKRDDPAPGRFAVPVVGRRTSAFGYRVHPVTKRSGSFHSGIDIAAPMGTRVYAAGDGVIKTAEYKRNGYGNLIIVAHADDYATWYGHLSRIAVSPGSRVRKGDYIGQVGSTGVSTGPHLHFEVRKGDRALNPDEHIR